MSKNKKDQDTSEKELKTADTAAEESIEITFEESGSEDTKTDETNTETIKDSVKFTDSHTKTSEKLAKKLKHGTMAAVSTVIFAAAVVLVNIIAGIFFDRYPLTLDLTKNAKYSISEESEEYVKRIDRDVLIRVFAPEEDFAAVNEYTMQANEVIKRYCQFNSHISAEYIDIDSNPDIVSEYADMNIAAFSIVVESASLDENGSKMYDEDGKQLKRVREVSLLDFITFTDEIEETAQYYGVTADYYLQNYFGTNENNTFALAVRYGLAKESTADQAFISALMAVTDPDPVVVSVLTGRGELTELTYLRKLLLANGYTVQDVNITSEEIPEDTDMCIIPAPQYDYMAAEIQKIDDFVYNDGNMGKQLIYIASYAQQPTPNIDEFLEEYNLKVDSGIIWENDPAYYSIDPMGQIYTIAADISDTYADTVDTDNMQILLSYSRPVRILAESGNRQSAEALISSTDAAMIMDSATNEVVENGKQVFAALSSKASFDGGGATYSNVLVVGSPEMLSDQVLMLGAYQNRAYILSLSDSLTGKTAGVRIEPKVVSGALFDITAEQIRTLKIIFMGVIPVITLATGLVIWLRRKNR